MMFVYYVAISFGKNYECGGIFPECKIKHKALDTLLELESQGKLRIEYRGWRLDAARESIADKIRGRGIARKLNTF